MDSTGNEIAHYCHYCGKSIVAGKFCDSVHEKDYEKTVSQGKELHLKIDDKTTVRTKKYDKVPQIIERYRNMISNPYTRRA